MSGENILAYGTQKTLESNGAAIASGNVVQATVAPYSLVADGGGYPDAIFVLTGTFATAPTENMVLGLYAQPLGIDGTNNAQVPEASRPTFNLGGFVVDNVTGQQSIQLTAYDVPRNANYFIHNNNTGQQLAAGWTLKVTPRTNKAAP